MDQVDTVSRWVKSKYRKYFQEKRISTICTFSKVFTIKKWPPANLQRLLRRWVVGGDPIGPFMARNARWIAPIMIAMESVMFGRICASVAKCFLHFLQCQVFKTPLDLSLTNGQSLLVMKSSCFQTVAQRSIWWPNWTIHGPNVCKLCSVQ